MPFLFSYGTLQHTDVQRSTFGRLLTGHADALRGYELSSVFSGGKRNANVVATARDGDSVSGTALDVTLEELAAADRFEAPFDYARIEVTLQSGRDAWVYAHRRPRG